MALTEAEELELLELEAAEASVPAEPRKYSADNVSGPEAFARGVEQAFPISDEGAGLGAGLYEVLNAEPDDERGALERFKAGFSGGRADELKQMAHAYDVKPGAFAAGAASGFGTQLTSAPASAGINSAIGAVQGASAGNSLGSRVAGAALGAALPQVPNARAALSRAVDPVLDAANLATIGLPQNVRTKIVQEYGSDGLAALGRFLREKGITNQPRFLSGVESAVDDVANQAGAKIGAAVDDIQMAPIPYGELVDNLGALNRPAQFGQSMYDDGVNAAREFVGQGNATPTDVWKMAQALDKQAGTFTKGGVSDKINQAEVFGDIAGNARQMLKDANPAVAPAMREYAMATAARKGVDAAAAATGAPIKYNTVLPKLYQNTIGSKPVMTSVNYVLERATRVSGGKYAMMFEQAATKGPAAVNALNYSLLQTDPEYNLEMMRGDDEQ